MSDARYHVRFADTASGDELGLLLVESPQIGFSKRLINPYAAKSGAGDTKDSDLTEWSVASFRDWRGGRGQELLSDKAAFLDSWNLESRIEGQLTLGPLPQNPTEPGARHEPGMVDGGWSEPRFGWPRGPEWTGNTLPSSEVYVNTFNWFAQLVEFEWITGHFDYRLASVELYVCKVAGTTEPLRLTLYGEDYLGQAGHELAYVDVAAGSISEDWAWVTCTFATPLDLYIDPISVWLMLSSDEGSGTRGYRWREHTIPPPQRGAGGTFGVSHDDGSTWTLHWDHQFLYKTHFSPIKLAQSFTAPTGGITCTQVYLVLGAFEFASSVTFRLCADNAGAPGTVLQSKVVTVDQYGYAWVEIEWDSGEALVTETLYWITAEHASEQAGQITAVGWYGDEDGEYAGGESLMKIGSGDWDTLSGGEYAGDRFFRVNDVGILDGNPVAFARFSGKWYVGAGDTVYVWDTVNLEWDVSDAQADDTITSMEVWGGYLWVARGSACYLRRFNGSAWADAGTVYAQLLRGGGGYLHRTDPTNQNYLYYTADGSTWSDAIVVGSSDFPITGMEWFRDMLVTATSVRLYGIAAEFAYTLLDWSTQENADNGRRMLYWSKTGALYIPLAYGLYRWNGDTMVAVGPEQGTGLPAGRDGKVAALCGTGNWLYAAVDGGAAGTSSILAYSGQGGWHELQRAEKAGDRIQALGFETISSPSRLWFGLGTGTRYLMLPDTSDNPYQWSGYEFNAGGELITSWMGGELLEVVKDLHQVVVRGEDFSSGQTVRVYYEVDRSGRWTYLGEVNAYPRSVLAFAASAFVTKTVGSGSTRTTIELASGSTTTDMAEGDWCRFSSGEVAQVASITDSGTFVLETALESAPAGGGRVYASGPAGREFRLKLILSTTAMGSTPKITAVFVRYQNNVLDRFIYSLQVRAEDGMTDLAGAPYPHTAADLRTALDGWAQRARAFTLYDPDGAAHTVKATSAGEGGWSRRQGEGQQGHYSTTYSINLVEVA